VAILEEDGYDGLTIAALCERANVTPPTVYARVADKETLLSAIYERGVAKLDRDAPLDEATTASEAVRALAATFLGNASLLRAMIHRAGTDPYVYRRGSEGTTDLARRFRTAVGGNEHRADACFRLVLASLARRVVYGAGFDSDLEQPDDELVEALCEMAELFLGTDSTRR
jgi:AcrR family transcriptional regulator